MENNENKKSKLGIIIIAIIIILLILFLVWFFLLRDNGKENSGNNSNNNEEITNTNNEVTPSKDKYEYSYFDGKLTQIVDEEGNPKQTDFIIDGIILVGNRHNYLDIADTEAVIEKLASLGYKKEDIYKDFYLNEWIEFYIDTNYSGSTDDVKILIVPHKTVEELEKMSYSQLEELANENGGFVLDYKTPEADNYKYVGNGYVNADYPEGKYDILFTYKGKLAYFINIEETKEPAE